MRQKLVGFTIVFPLFCLALVFAGPSAQTGTVKGAETAKSDTASPESREAYVIGVEDLLSINVWKEPDFSIKELVVRSDGKISLPLASDIQASGLTPKQLEDAITAALKENVKKPIVTVTILKSLSRSVSVVGQVSRPGIYQMVGHISVLELLARAGGVTEFARAKDIKVVRNVKGKIVQFPFNYKDVIRGRNLQQNITLEIGDQILVP
jgi:polysaccharide biosynthesis/export protein